MGKCLFMRKGETHTAPVTGIQLGDIAEGSIVKLNENGSPVEFYVAKHDYESALNGLGRTLLLRKNCYEERTWGKNSDTKVFPDSSIFTWLNGTYKNLFDTQTKSAIGSTKFYYSSSNTQVTSNSASVFMLSLTEFGRTSTYANTEGSSLPNASKYRVAPNSVMQWTRTPYNRDQAVYIFFISENGSSNWSNDYYEGVWVRPCFTLPSGACFDEETMLFNGKIA